ncbi:MAG: acetyl-CoA carboxylase biotin carboxyl carrier protein [Ignavibacteriaceae bacterium]|nr:acetyl-CoA carboxylase biotin carboxyl carrier protein [Ignavibacteria bacterium]NNJ54187.1 acetyl-CoA carboxylase biotin carboxyl carrier protein [Ignavibacteriaceae bacterium]NNL20694.1 acetyl-CoA carboxylase biotin carboxyl carrier protein [Ignavibacteriaceae bacterium]
MDLNLIKRLVKIVDTSGITDLEIEQDGVKIKIAKKIRNSQMISTMQVPESEVQKIVSATPPAQNIPEAAIESVKEEEQTAKNLHEIRSPIVGTFYGAPSPDDDAFVQVGTSVSPGSVLCIVEAMKLMNEIEADVNGKIIKILAENGKPVEYNQPLFLIELT